MTSGFRLLVAFSVGLVAACPSDDEPDAPADPVEYYGPCAGNPYCGDGSGLAEQSSDGTCTCTVFCEQDADCPMPDSGTSTPFCEMDDVVVNGMSGECKLPCDEMQTCPDEMECRTGRCTFAG